MKNRKIEICINKCERVNKSSTSQNESKKKAGAKNS
jgi:hypothetical protein